MKKLLAIFSLALSLQYTLQAGTDKPKPQPLKNPAYAIKVKIAGLKDTSCYLAYHFGDKQYLKDTALVDSKGNMLFDGKEKLPGGIYMVVLPSRNNFEFIVPADMQMFSLETDTARLASDMKVIGSKENEVFFGFLRFIAQKSKQAEPLAETLKKFKDNKDSALVYQKKLGTIDKEVKEYKSKLITDNPTLFVSKVFRSSTDPEIPEAPLLSNGRRDSTFAYKWLKKHYFDNVDMTENNLVRTPIIHTKMKYYLENLTPQVPDSINKSADFILSKAEASKDIFKYVVWYVTNTYETSNIMGMDAVFVHMAEKYYGTGKAFWVDSTTRAKITERGQTLKPLLLGKKAPNLTLPDTADMYHTLHNQKAKYIILYFWDPDCGHCQKETPKLNDLYKEQKIKGLAVYSVSTDHPANWKKYVRNNKLTFLNVNNAIGDKTVHYDLRKMYDVYSTPTIYILNEKKEIIAKRLGVDQISEFLENYDKMMESKDKKSN